MEVVPVILPDGSIAEVPSTQFSLDVDGLGVVTVHETQGPARLIERFHRAAYLALTEAVMSEIQEAENMLWNVLLATYIDSAEGVALNMIGLRVGEPRQSLNDPDYRVRIKARILINRSFGLAEDLLAILRALGSPGEVRNTGNASVRVDVDEIPSNGATRRQLASLLGEAVSAGVRLHVSIPASATPFILGSVTGAIAGEGLLGSVTDPDTGYGELTDGRMV